MYELEIVVVPRDQLEQIYYVLRVQACNKDIKNIAYNKSIETLIEDLGDILGVENNDVYCA